MISKSEMTIKQVFFILLLSIGLVNHVQMIPILLQNSGKDSWIAVSIAFPVVVIFVCLIGFVLKRIGQTPFLIWIEQKSNRFLAIVIALIFFLHFFINALLTLKGVIDWTQVTYLRQTPLFVTTLALLLLVLFLVFKGLRTIGIVATILLPFVLLAGYFVMTANFQYKDYQLLLPLFTRPFYDIAITILYIVASTLELISVLFIQHRLNKKLKTSHLIWLSFFLITLTMGPLMGSIAAFGPFSSLMRFPAFEQWLLVQIGDYISNVDFLSIYQWLSGAFVRLAFEFFLLGEIAKYLFNLKRVIYVYVTVAVILLFVTIAPITFITDSIRFYEWYMQLVFYTYMLTIFLFVLLAIMKKKGGKHEHEKVNENESI